jgi:hypothetical protein
MEKLFNILWLITGAVIFILVLIIKALFLKRDDYEDFEQ